MSLATLKARLERAERRCKLFDQNIAKRIVPAWLDGMPGAPGAEWSYDALPAQKIFHSDLTTRFKGYSGPIGSGKSHALAYEALILSRTNPGLLGLIGAPTYTMLADSTQRTLFEVLAKEDIPYILNKQDNRLRFLTNGSEIIFRSMDNPERLRGPNLAWFALDELTYTHEDAWTRMLGRLRHPEARRLCGCAVWTPKGFDWVYKRFVEDKNPDYRLIQATPKENIHLPQDFYDRLKSSYNALFFRQEALGEYLDIFAGCVFHSFSDANIKWVKYDPNLPICWTNDFNVDPLCSLICQVINPNAGGVRNYYDKPYINVIDEIAIPSGVTEFACREFMKRMDELNENNLTVTVYIYGDKSGGDRHSSAHKTDYQMIESMFKDQRRFTPQMRRNTSNPPLIDRINETNNMLRSFDGEQHVFIDPKCKRLIRDLRQVAWKRDSWGNRVNEQSDANPELTHMSDALGYLIWKEFQHRAPCGLRPGSPF